MRSSGNWQQSGSEVESKAPILSHRKRSTDLVRQAQFAAYSYFGFDPYEEKHKTALLHRQVFTSEGSIPLELHLHHHHHHNYWEAEDILKKPLHTRASGDSSLAVENLLSICDQIHLFQDAWQGNIRVDEKSQKFMLQGPLIRRDATNAGLEGGMSLNPQKRDLAERNFTERCWSGRGTSSASPITKSKVTGNEIQHINREARFSHWECRVAQEDKLTKGCGAGVRSIGKGHLPSSDGTFDFMNKNAEHGFKPASNNEYSRYHSLSSNGWKKDRNSNDSTMAAFSGSTRNSLPTAIMDSGSDSTSWVSSDTKLPNNQHQKVQTSSDNAMGFLGMSPTSSSRQAPRNYADQERCKFVDISKPNFYTYDRSRLNIETIPLHMDKMCVHNIKQGGLFSCDGCTCQSPTQVYQEGFEVQMTVSGQDNDLKESLESSNVENRKYDIKEKIIGLNENEDDKECNLHCIRQANEKILYKKLIVSEGKNGPSSASIKVSDECNGNVVWNEARMQQWQCRNDESSVEMSTRELRGDHSLTHDSVPIDSQDTSKESFSDERNKVVTNGAFCSAEMTHFKDALPTIHYHLSHVEIEPQEMRMSKSSMALHREPSNNGSHWECRVFNTPGNATQEREKKKLDLELEARLAAEEKARKYEASAEAAEHRLLKLLEERTKLHRKFDEEVEQKEIERMHLNRLFEQEKRKSEAAKKELQELKEKFALVLSKVPMSPRVVADNELHEWSSTTPRSARKTSGIIEEHDVTTERPEQSQICMPNHYPKCRNLSKEKEQIQENQIVRQMISKNHEPSILQIVQLQEMQLTAVENAFQELERKVKQVDMENIPCAKNVPQDLKTSEKEDNKISPKDSAGLIKENSQALNNSEGVENPPPIDSAGFLMDDSQASKNIENAIRTASDGVLEKFKSVYQSPIFEHSQLSEEPNSIGGEMLNNKVTERDESLVTTVDEKVEPMNQLDNTTEILRRKLREKEEQLNTETSCSQLHQLNKQLESNLNKSETKLSELQEKYDGLAVSAASTENRLRHLNKQLESNLAMSETKLSELQKDYDGLVASAASAESQLKDAQKDAEDLRRTTEELCQNLSVSEKKVIELMLCAEKKESQMRELMETVEELELKRDLGEKEKIELSKKLDKASKELDEQNSRVAEYSNINEELLDFAQKKETEVTYVKQQLQTLQQHMSEKTSVIRKLEMELEKQQKEVNQMQRSYRSVASEREAMESRLAEKNIQLLQQEGTISTLTKQLEDIMEVRDSMLEEVAQFHDQLQNAKYKEFETEGKLKNSSLIINELEEKILWMNNDSRKAKMELTDLKHQNTALQKLILQKNEETKELKHAINDLKKKVQELEEEVLVKEGQIAIISSQNRESYESF